MKSKRDGKAKEHMIIYQDKFKFSKKFQQEVNIGNLNSFTSNTWNWHVFTNTQKDLIKNNNEWSNITLVE